jgi:hypothetical protein
MKIVGERNRGKMEDARKKVQKKNCLDPKLTDKGIFGKLKSKTFKSNRKKKNTKNNISQK